MGDARELSKIVGEHAPFKAAFFAWTSVIGYRDEEDDIAILRECWKVVEDGGYLLILDHSSRDLIAFLSSVAPAGGYASYYGDLVIIEHPRFKPEEGVVENVWRFYRRKENGDLKLLAEIEFRLRAYTLAELVRLARQASWELHLVLDPSLEPGSRYRPALNALNVVFRKRS